MKIQYFTTREEMAKALNVPVRSYNNLRGLIEEFSKVDDNIMVLDPKEFGYSTARIAASSIVKAIKRSGYNMRCHIHEPIVWIENIKED